MKATSEKRRTVRQANLLPTRVIIENNTYQVVNVSREGIGIRIEGEHSFYLGQRVTSIAIETQDKTCSFDGAITHITHQQATVVCGIRFDLGDIDAYNHMAQYVEERSA